MDRSLSRSRTPKAALWRALLCLLLVVFAQSLAVSHAHALDDLAGGASDTAGCELCLSGVDAPALGPCAIAPVAAPAAAEPKRVATATCQRNTHFAFLARGPPTT